MVHPGIQFKPVEGDALLTDRDFSQVGPDFGIEPVAIHAEVDGRIPKADHPRQESKLSDSIAHDRKRDFPNQPR